MKTKNIKMFTIESFLEKKVVHIKKKYSLLKYALTFIIFKVYLYPQKDVLFVS